MSQLEFDPELLKLKSGMGADEITQLLGIVYSGIQKILKRYMELGDEDRHILALWILAANYKDAFNTMPILYINASSGSGKTRLMNLLAALLPNSLMSADISQSAFFRIAQDANCILIDEAEHISFKEKGALKQLLNVCYKRGGSVMRTEKEPNGRFKVVRFDVFKPVALANVFGLDSILESRCIAVYLLRTSNNDVITMPEAFAIDPEVIAIKEFLDASAVNVISYVELLVKDYYATLFENLGIDIHTYKPTPTYTTFDYKEFLTKVKDCRLDGRNFELWLPFFMLSKIVPELDFKHTLEMAKQKAAIKQEDAQINDRDTSIADSLYRFIKNGGNNPVFKGQEFVKEHESTEGNADWLSNEWLGHFLRRSGVLKSSRRLNTGMEYTIDLIKLKEYLRVRGIVEQTQTVLSPNSV